jgi:hypothetical protein
MQKTLEDVRDELLKLRPLPEGYCIECEHNTGNLLVKGPSLGFAITKNAIGNNYYADQYPPTLERLIEVEADEANQVKKDAS